MRHSFIYRDNSLYCEETPLAAIAEAAGTPAYVYSSRDIAGKFREYEQGLKELQHKVCYAVKANGNLAVLHLLARDGAGFDIVSGGELFRVLKAGGRAADTVFSGVGKTAAEIEYGLREGIHSFNSESEAELELIDSIARKLGRRASAAVRVNPDVDAATHPYISTGLEKHKFGIDIREVQGLFERAARFKNVDLAGISCHIGSQLLDFSPLLESVDRMLELARRLRQQGFEIRFLDLGGGVGIPYKPEDEGPELAAFLHRVTEHVSGAGLEVLFEPGRSVVAESGVLLTKVLYRKTTAKKIFVVVDAAMNDLIRPSLYNAHHEIIPVKRAAAARITADVVGPVCESSDFLALDREMPDVAAGDVLAVCSAGAYSFAMSSNYNARPRVPEVMVEGATWRVVRRRETHEDLIRGESL